jgi:hypothetical protein
VVEEEFLGTDNEGLKFRASQGHPCCKRYASFKRLGLHLFLENFFHLFDVGIWTTTTSRHANTMLDCILSEQERNNLEFFWTSEKSYNTKVSNPYACNWKSTIVLKDVQAIWHEFGDMYGQTNTILVETSP